MDEFKKEALRLRLDKLLNQDSFFTVCAVDSLAKMIGVNAKAHPDYQQLRALHCVDYSEMSDAMKAELPAKIMKCLTTSFDTSIMSKAIAAVAAGEIKSQPQIEDVEISHNQPLRLYNSN